MSKIQYTIRKVPEALDQSIRVVAEKSSKSINSLIIETLEKQFLHVKGVPVHTDLNQFSGSWEEDPGFDQAIAVFDEIDESAWQ